MKTLLNIISNHPSGTLTGEILLHLPIPFAFLDWNGKLIWKNDFFSDKLFEFDVSKEASFIFEIFPTLDRARWGMLQSSLSELETVKITERIGDSQKKSHSIEIFLQPIRSEEASGVLLCFQRLEDQKEFEGIRLLQNEVLESVATGKPISLIMDILCRRVESLATDVLCSVLLVDAGGRLHPCAGPSIPKVFSDAIENLPIGPKTGSCGTSAYRGEPVEVVDIETDPLWEDYKDLALPLNLRACWSTPIKLRDGRVRGTFALYYREPRGASDFHRKMVAACVHLCSLALEHEENQQQIHQLAFYDSLTGLANRNLFKDRANRLISQIKPGMSSIAFIFLDLDRFKTVNDSLGHNTGDLLLKKIAKRLLLCIKPDDTLARLGGDEFLILVPDTNETGVQTLTEKILENIQENVFLDGNEFQTSASIGISMAPNDATDVETLLKYADVAMYRAKAEGRNTFRFYQSEMNEHATARLRMESELRKALVQNEFEVYYQPQVDIRKNSIHGVESLIRWKHPQWGLISPMNFIPVAEDSGLIGAIDFWVLENSLKQWRAWNDSGIMIPNVSVNLSVSDFSGSTLIEKIDDLLKKYSVPAGVLTLEITESLMMEDKPELISTFHHLHKLGVQLSLDDFGTGYSSLTYLQKYPMNELKLDRSFVNALSRNTKADRALINAMIQLGTAFEYRIIAEGVEKVEQLEYLWEKSCYIIQGYYFSKPLSATELITWLRDFSTQP